MTGTDGGRPFASADPPPRASVIVVSRGRPDWLSGCLRALMLQDHPAFEVIVVADPAGLRRTEGLPVKRVAFDRANISAARNAGLGLAAGVVAAFIDDDAIAEPDWLRALTAPFVDPLVVAAGGAVRGRDGLGWQFRAGWVDATGLAARFDPGPATRLFAAEDGRTIATIGTNCAFRRDALAAIGGFDPAFAYHLDETDVNLRLAATWGLTAVVPGAEVIHAAAASPRRSGERVTRDLRDIGASSAVFWRKHAPDAEMAPLIEALTGAQRRRLIGQMLAGRIEPGEVRHALSTLTAGLAEGAARPLAPLAPIPPAEAAFAPVSVTPRRRVVLTGRRWNQRRLRDEARAAAADGAIVTLLMLSRTALPHRVRFDPGGWWEQTGGLWGTSHPGLPRPWASRFDARCKREIALIPAARRG